MATCGACVEEVKDLPKPQPRIVCKYCEKVFHAKCAQIPNNLISFFVSNENYLWFCDVCVSIASYSIKVHKCIGALYTHCEQMENELKLQSSKIDALKSVIEANKVQQSVTQRANTRKRTFASVVSDNYVSTPVTTNNVYQSAKRTRNDQPVKQRNSREPILIVKPNPEVDKASVTNNIKRVLNPISDPIKGMHETSNGNIVITCKTYDDVSAMKQKLSSMSNVCEINERTKVLPTIKLVGISEYNESQSADFIQKLRVQNELPIDSHVELLSVKEIKDRKYYTAYIRADVTTYELIMQKKRLYVGWDSVKCYQYVNVLRCFKCSSFGHIAEKCDAMNQVCPRCSEDHDIKDCQSDEAKCPNCVAANSKFNTNFDTGHSAWDKNCPVLNKRLKTIRNRTVYD